MDGWMDEWMDEWMNGWMDEWVNKWVKEIQFPLSHLWNPAEKPPDMVHEAAAAPCEDSGAGSLLSSYLL